MNQEITAIFSTTLNNVVGINLSKENFDALVKVLPVIKYSFIGFFLSQAGKVNNYQKINYIMSINDFFTQERSNNVFDLGISIKNDNFRPSIERKLYVKKEIQYLTQNIIDQLLFAPNGGNTSEHYVALDFLKNHNIEEIRSMIDISDILE